MQEFRVCFVGIGSIAKRHIHNLREVCSLRNMNVVIDAYRHSSCSSNVDGVDHVYTCFDDVYDQYDAVFITNPTEFHLDSLKQFHDKSRCFFIEKPLTSVRQMDSISDFPWIDGNVYYVACPLRYTSVIQYIAKHIDLDKLISIRSISSSYLPSWRPDQDYRDTYSAHKELGGGVSIDLIHEWDYLTFLLGNPVHVKSFIGKKSKLEINSDDYAIYIGEYDQYILELHLDYFGRKTIRQVQLFLDDEVVVGDLVANKISFLVSGKVIEFDENRDDYQKRELDHYLDIVLNGIHNDSDFQHAYDVLKLTQGEY